VLENFSSDSDVSSSPVGHARRHVAVPLDAHHHVLLVVLQQGISLGITIMQNNVIKRKIKPWGALEM